MMLRTLTICLLMLSVSGSSLAVTRYITEGNPLYLHCHENQVDRSTLPPRASTAQTISHITFASYGIQTRSQDGWAVGECHAKVSKSVVQSACLGKSNCTLLASSALFGEPCSGKKKRLVVSYECSITERSNSALSPAPSSTHKPVDPSLGAQ